MALRWRIRHKLLVGLGVVVGIIALVITGTLYGLAAFSATVKTADSKIAELNDAQALKQITSYLRSTAAQSGLPVDSLETELRGKAHAARETTDSLSVQFQDTVKRGREVDTSDHEESLIKDVYRLLDQLDWPSSTLRRRTSSS